MFRRSAHRFVACTPTLQAIISGTAAIGGSTCSRIAAGHGGKGKAHKPRNKRSCKHGEAQPEKRSDVVHTQLLRRPDRSERNKQV